MWVKWVLSRQMNINYKIDVRSGNLIHELYTPKNPLFFPNNMTRFARTNYMFAHAKKTIYERYDILLTIRISYRKNRFMNHITFFSVCRHITRFRSSFVFFNFLSLVIPTWWSCERMKWDQHQHHILRVLKMSVVIDFRRKGPWIFFVECDRTAWRRLQTKSVRPI
jgi:hypothetical protein